MKKNGKKVVVAVDGGTTCKEALERALNNDIITPADTVQLLSVVDPAGDRPPMVTPSGVSVDTFYSMDGVPDKEQLEARKTVLQEYEALVKKKGIGCNTATVVGSMGSSTDHGRHICKYAEDEHADMIILGSRGMSSMKKKALGLIGLGSVSSYVLDHATTPDVLVHRHCSNDDN